MAWVLSCFITSELSVEEELDYNENMDELDLYPVGDLDINDSEEKGGDIYKIM